MRSKAREARLLKSARETLSHGAFSGCDLEKSASGSQKFAEIHWPRKTTSPHYRTHLELVQCGAQLRYRGARSSLELYTDLALPLLRVYPSGER